MDNLPRWVKPFDDAFKQVANRWDYSQVFDDFLDIAISKFQIVPIEGLSERLERRYSTQELDGFQTLIHTWVCCVRDEMKDSDWIYRDLLGTYYEYIAGKFKRSNFGQFFTPEDIAELATQITIGEPTGKTAYVSDPACGSGRMLLSAYMHLKGKMLAFGEDLDGMCCRMTLLNFLIHGVEGEIVQHDTLAADHFIKAWRVNEYRKQGIVSIRPITREESYIMGQRRAASGAPPKKEDKPAEQMTITF